MKQKDVLSTMINKSKDQCVLLLLWLIYVYLLQVGVLALMGNYKFLFSDYNLASTTYYKLVHILFYEVPSFVVKNSLVLRVFVKFVTEVQIMFFCDGYTWNQMCIYSTKNITWRTRDISKQKNQYLLFCLSDTRASQSKCHRRLWSLKRSRSNGSCHNNCKQSQ